MATNKERLDGIEARLVSIDKHLGIASPVKSRSLWNKAGDHKVVAGLIVAAILGLCSLVASAFHSKSNEYVDGRIQTQLSPVSAQLSSIDERLSRTEGALSVLRAEAAAAKYVKSPEKELKTHHDELRDIKDRLAQSKPNVPGYWPAAFQIITLFSRATFDVEKVAAGPETSYDNVVSNPPGIVASTENSRVVLKNLVQGMVFKNSIIRFDPSVHLVNDVFINCVFIFPSTGETPPARLQRIGETLLSSDLSRVTLNAS
jgi:hypothetical protein